MDSKDFKAYIITIEDATGNQRLIDEIFPVRDYAKDRISGSDSRFCYYYVYEIWFEDNELKHRMTDKIWNNL